MPLKLVILGKQGSGKGTQCELLVERYQVTHISTGDMLRAAVAAGTPLGQKAQAVMAAGDLVSDELILGLVKERLTQSDVVEHGFLLDGFPRTAAQAKGLLEILAQSSGAVNGAVANSAATNGAATNGAATNGAATNGAATNGAASSPVLDLVIDLFVPDEVVSVRMRARGREDDTPEAIARRLALYEAETAPLRTAFAKDFSLATIDGLGTPAEVHERISQAVDAARNA